MARRSIIGATRNIASLPGQAIPLLGTTLIAGVAAWDFYDLCENMKDINGLIEKYTEAANRIDQVNMNIQVPPLKNMTQSFINKSYDFYGKFVR